MEKLKGKHPTLDTQASHRRGGGGLALGGVGFPQVVAWARLQGKGHPKCGCVDRETRAIL